MKTDSAKQGAAGRRPAVSQRAVLLLALGRQVNTLTAALSYYAACVQPPVLFDRVVITKTAQGRATLQRLRRRRELARWARLYGCRAPRLVINQIRDGAATATDIDTAHTLELAQRAVFRAFRDCKQRGERVYVCLAGGRKLLSLLQVQAAMQYGDHDEVFQLVLPRALEDGDCRILTPEEACAQLTAVTIPYVRLNGMLTGSGRPVGADFDNAVAASRTLHDLAQAATGIRLEIDLARRLALLEGKIIPFTPKELTLYAFFAQQRRQHPLRVQEIAGHVALAALGRQLFPLKRFVFSSALVREHISRINRKLALLSGTTQSPARIVSTGTHGRRCYGLALPPRQLRLRAGGKR